MFKLNTCAFNFWGTNNGSVMYYNLFSSTYILNSNIKNLNWIITDS